MTGRVRLRYWAAARAAAGVAEETCPAGTLAAAIRHASETHGERLASVLAHCSFVVDGAPVGRQDPDLVLLPDSAVVEVLPPFAGGAADTEPAREPAGEPAREPAGEPAVVAAAVGPPPAPRAAGHPLAAGVSAAVVAFAAAGASYGGRPVLAGAVFVIQVLLTLGWFAVLDTPGSLGGFVVCVGAGGAAAGLLVTGDGSLGRVAGVAGIGFLAALLHQVTRRHRARVTESLAGTVSGLLLGLAAASLIALRGGPSGGGAAVSALVGAGAALLLARLVDVAVDRPAVAFGCTRGWPGVLVGMVGAAAAGYGYAALAGSVHRPVAVALAAASAALALAADVAVDLGRGALVGVGHERQLAALTPLTALLPLAVSCPAAYLVGRVMLG